MKYVKFNVSEERYTILKQYGFENIDALMNSLLDKHFEQRKDDERSLR